MPSKRDLNGQMGRAFEKHVAKHLTRNGYKNRFSIAFTDYNHDKKLDQIVYDNETKQEFGFGIRCTRLFKRNGRKCGPQYGRIIIPRSEYALWRAECEYMEIRPIWVAGVEYGRHNFIMCKGFYPEQLESFLRRNHITLSVKRIEEYGYDLMDIMRGFVQEVKLYNGYK